MLCDYQNQSKTRTTYGKFGRWFSIAESVCSKWSKCKSDKELGWTKTSRRLSKISSRNIGKVNLNNVFIGGSPAALEWERSWNGDIYEILFVDEDLTEDEEVTTEEVERTSL